MQKDIKIQNTQNVKNVQNDKNVKDINQFVIKYVKNCKMRTIKISEKDLKDKILDAFSDIFKEKTNLEISLKNKENVNIDLINKEIKKEIEYLIKIFKDMNKEDLKEIVKLFKDKIINKRERKFKFKDVEFNILIINNRLFATIKKDNTIFIIKYLINVPLMFFILENIDNYKKIIDKLENVKIIERIFLKDKHLWTEYNIYRNNYLFVLQLKTNSNNLLKTHSSRRFNPSLIRLENKNKNKKNNKKRLTIIDI